MVIRADLNGHIGEGNKGSDGQVSWTGTKNARCCKYFIPVKAGTYSDA